MSNFDSIIGKRKVTIIGAGYVGSTIAYALTIKGLAREIVLIDKDEQKSVGESLDISHGISYMGVGNVTPGSYRDISDSDLIIITAGRNRLKGESRMDLAIDNTKTLRFVYESIRPYYNGRSLIMIIANPVDILTQKMTEWMNVKRGLIFGSGAFLDTSRVLRCLSNYLNISIENISGFVAGEHGDTQFPAWSKFFVAGIPLDEYCKSTGIAWDKEIRISIEEKVKRMGGEIILAKGRTHYGIATAVCYLAEAILNQRTTVVSICSELKGEYGFNNISMSVPSILSSNGVERILEETFSEHENEMLKRSAKEINNVLKQLKDI